MTRPHGLEIHVARAKPAVTLASGDSPAQKPRVLIVLHQEHSTPGRIGRILEAQGAELDIRRPRYGDPLPVTMADHAGAVIFGGPMSANDPDDYIKQEIDWINVPLKQNKPYLGVCLGAQLLARCLGARVYKPEDNTAEVGYYPITPSIAGRAVCTTAFPEQVYQWHREGFDLPSGATLLASGDETFGVQACRHGANAYGLQFHPEVTYAMICRWVTRAWHNMNVRGAREPHEHRDGWYQHDAAVHLWTQEFLRNWLATEVA